MRKAQFDERDSYIHKSLIKLIVAIGFVGDGKVSREYLDGLLVACIAMVHIIPS